jgi:hypothetical protein
MIRTERRRGVATLSLLLAALLAALLAGCAAPERTAAPPGAASGALGWRVESPWPESRVHRLRVDLRAPGVQIALSPPAERGRTIDAMSGTARASASFNASFFDRDFRPRGITVSEGKPWPEVLQPESSPLLACDAALRCAIDFDGAAKADPAWRTAVAGTPWLVRKGRPRGAADDAGCAALCAQRHPRTAIGLADGGRTLVVVLVEGRRDGARGATLAELAAYLRAQGVEDAINLDGGGSSTLWINGRAVMSRPVTEPSQRPLANALHLRVP